MRLRGKGGLRYRGQLPRITGAVVLTAAGVLAMAGCSTHGAAAAHSTATTTARPPQATASAVATPSATTAATTTAPPVTGHVANGVHTGDLRYFFLPIPQHAVPLGDPDGESLTPVEVVDNPDAAASTAVLKKYRYRAGFHRSYSDGHTQVVIKLAQFGSPALAAAYYRQHHYSGPGIRPLALDLPFPAGAMQTVPGSKYHQLLGFTYQGDVQVTVRLDATDGSTLPSRTQLASLLEAQYQRLKNGR